MKTVIAHLVVEHSQSDPNATYSLYDNQNFAAISHEIDVEGWPSGTVEPITIGTTKATFGKVTDLVRFCNIFNVAIGHEINCWIED